MHYLKMKVPLLCRRPVRGWPWPWRHGVFRNTELFKFPRPSVRHPIHHGRDNEVLLSRPPARPPALCPPLPNFSLPCGPSIATGPSFDVNGHWLTYLSREAPRKAPGEARPLLRHLISFLPAPGLGVQNKIAMRKIRRLDYWARKYYLLWVA